MTMIKPIRGNREYHDIRSQWPLTRYIHHVSEVHAGHRLFFSCLKTLCGPPNKHFVFFVADFWSDLDQPTAFFMAFHTSRSWPVLACLFLSTLNFCAAVNFEEKFAWVDESCHRYRDSLNRAWSEYRALAVEGYYEISDNPMKSVARSTMSALFNPPISEIPNLEREWPIRFNRIFLEIDPSHRPVQKYERFRPKRTNALLSVLWPFCFYLCRQVSRRSQEGANAARRW